MASAWWRQPECCYINCPDSLALSGAAVRLPGQSQTDSELHSKEAQRSAARTNHPVQRRYKIANKPGRLSSHRRAQSDDLVSLLGQFLFGSKSLSLRQIGQPSQ